MTSADQVHDLAFQFWQIESGLWRGLAADTLDPPPNSRIPILGVLIAAWIAIALVNYLTKTVLPHDLRPKELAPSRIKMRSSLPKLAGQVFPFAFLASALGISAICFFLFSPHEKDRWVKVDGTLACSDEEVLADIQGYRPKLRRREIEQSVRDQTCTILLADQRVRLVKVGEDGAHALCQIKGRSVAKWLELTALTHQRFFTLPWFPEKAVASDHELNDVKQPESNNETEAARVPDTPTPQVDELEEFEAGLKNLESDLARNESKATLAPSKEKPKLQPKVAATDMAPAEAAPQPDWAGPGGATDFAWTTVAVKDWLTVELPSSWVIASPSERENLAEVLGKVGMSKATVANSFMATVPTGAPTNTAHMNIRFYPARTETQTDIRSSATDIAWFDSLMKQEMLKLTTFKVSKWNGTHTEKIDDRVIFITEYVREPIGSSGDRPSNVRMFRLFDASRSFTLTVSYEVDAAANMRSVTDRIARSFKVKNQLGGR